jgi:glycerophosphoryl diester phosphodiesterase
MLAAAPDGGARTRAPLVVIGHRGKGMNALASPDERLREVKENSVRSFNDASRVAGVGYVEFDVQVNYSCDQSVNIVANAMYG